MPSNDNLQNEAKTVSAQSISLPDKTSTDLDNTSHMAQMIEQEEKSETESTNQLNNGWKDKDDMGAKSVISEKADKYKTPLA